MRPLIELLIEREAICLAYGIISPSNLPRAAELASWAAGLTDAEVDALQEYHRAVSFRISSIRERERSPCTTSIQPY